MSKPENLVGLRFGKLIVTEPRRPYITPDGAKRNVWHCVCECGSECDVRGDYLKRGQKTSCGNCAPLPWASSQHGICRRCEHSSWNEGGHKWDCAKGLDSTVAMKSCKGYWCGEIDKVTNIRNRKGTCIICGKPVYSYNSDVAIYCEEHKAFAEKDTEIIQNAPKELLFCLVAGIFQRARDDYIYNTDGMRSDARWFLRSQWAQELSLSEFDAEEVLKLLDEEIANESEQDREDIAG